MTPAMSRPCSSFFGGEGDTKMVLKDWVPDVMEPTLLGRGSNSGDKQGNTQNAFHLVSVLWRNKAG